MNRIQFLQSIGLSGSALLAVLMSCEQKKDEPKPSTSGNNSNKIDFTLDLTDSAYSALKTTGSFVDVRNIIVANTGSGYAAVTKVCSHQNNAAITYNASANVFVCTVHGARFDTQGKGLNALGSSGLKTFSTRLDGDTLRIYEP